MIEIVRARDIKRTEKGLIAFAWTQEEVIKTCYTNKQFIDYVEDENNDLSDIVAFTPSGSGIVSANNYIAKEIYKRSRRV